MIVNNKIPNESDWGDIDNDLDVKYSYEIYLNRSNAEMMSRFINAPVESAGEIEFMPIYPFQYYICGLADAVISLEECVENNSDAASSFLRLIEKIAKTNKDMLKPVFTEIEPKLTYIAEHQVKFDADIDIYGSFNEIYQTIKRLMV